MKGRPIVIIIQVSLMLCCTVQIRSLNSHANILQFRSLGSMIYVHVYPFCVCNIVMILKWNCLYLFLVCQASFNINQMKLEIHIPHNWLFVWFWFQLLFTGWQEEGPNDRKIGKLCDYAARNPLRIPKVIKCW
jgi:hypothetical protein